MQAKSVTSILLYAGHSSKQVQYVFFIIIIN